MPTLNSYLFILILATLAIGTALQALFPPDTAQPAPEPEVQAYQGNDVFCTPINRLQPEPERLAM